MPASLCEKIIEYGLIFLIIFTPLVFGTVHVWSITIMELTVIFLLGVWLVKRLSSSGPELIITPLNLPILFFVCLVLFHLLPLPPFAIKYLSPNTYDLYKMTLPGHDIGWRTLSMHPHATKTELFKTLACFVVFFIVINNIKSKRQIKHLLIALIITGFFMVFFSVIQRVSADQIYWFPGFTQAGYTLGPYVSKNHLAGYMEMVIPLSIGLLFSHYLMSSSSGKTGSWRHRLSNLEPHLSKYILLIFAIVIMIPALFLSLSRGGMIGFLVSMIFLANIFAYKRRKRSIIVLAFIFSISVLILIWLGIDPVIGSLSNLFSPYGSLASRTELWQDSFQIIRHFPIFGTGLGTYQYIFPKYKRMARGDLLYDHAHNDYLEFLSDTGILGFLLFFGMTVLFLARGFKKWRERKDPFAVGMGAGGLAGILAILIHSSVDFNLKIPANMLLLLIVFGLTNNTLHLRHSEEGEVFSASNRTFTLNPRSRTILYLLCLTFLGVLASIIIRGYMAERSFSQLRIMDKVDLATPATVSSLYRTINLDPSNSRYHYYLGKAYEGIAIKQKSIDDDMVEFLKKAKLSYIKAICLEPTNAWYHLNLGWLYEQLSYMDSFNPWGISDSRLNKLAQKEFDLARTLDPKNPHIRDYLDNLKKI